MEADWLLFSAELLRRRDEPPLFFAREEEDFRPEDFLALFFLAEDFFALVFLAPDFFALLFFAPDFFVLDLRELLFFALDFLPLVFFALDFFALVFFALVRFALVLRPVLLLARLLEERLFFGAAGTFAPSRRASDRPIAMACFGLVTLRPLRPDFSLPFFIARISRSTDFDAFGLYFRPELRCDVFFVAMLASVAQVCAFSLMKLGGKRGRYGCYDSARGAELRLRECGQDLVYIDPRRGILPGVAGHAELVFTAHRVAQALKR